VLKKFVVRSKRFNKQCDVECCTPQEAQQMAADFDAAFVLSYNNPLTVQEV